MDFKRIEWIFLVVFIGINIFLGIEILQAPTLLNSAHSASGTPVDLSTEIKADNISVPKVNDVQGEGYYLASKIDNSWFNKAKDQLKDNSNLEINTSTDDNALSATLSRPVSISSNKAKAIRQIKEFKNNPKYVYQGKQYTYVPHLSGRGEYVFAQKSEYGLIYSTSARLHITVKDNQITAYLQRYAGKLTPVRERQTTISPKAAINSLYTYSELPNDSKVLWLKFGYSKLIKVNGSLIFLPSWVAAVENNNTKTISIKKVNAFTGNILQQNTMTDDKDEK